MEGLRKHLDILTEPWGLGGLPIYKMINAENASEDIKISDIEQG